MKQILILISLVLTLVGCAKGGKAHVLKEKTPFVWEAANVYFLLTDRFNNGDISNDVNFERKLESGKLRGFEGGDIKGITQKIEDGYFSDLGINAIWMTPIVEQIHGGTDEGTGLTYGYHGYWASDWTSIDPNFGTNSDLKTLVEVAHKHGIRILLDAVINHTGPVTEKDTLWPESWVRKEPKCDYTNFENTTSCTLVENLPDIKTESNEPVELPYHLVEKWKKEGRYEEEVAELDTFFERTGHPRAPRFYIMKWLSDYITDFGIDGYRCDTVKHTDPIVWEEFKTVCDDAFSQFKKANPEKVLDDNAFYLVGEVYNYSISGGKYFDFGDKKVNYFDNMFSGQINFEFKWNAAEIPIDVMFEKYDNILQSNLKGYSVLNYVSSHDDDKPFDAKREKALEAGTKLLLSPGVSQVYYGDETSRSLVVKDTQGDATLRSFMNWEDIQNTAETRQVLRHWQKLGKFRIKHPAIGAGKHETLSQSPFVFSRKFKKDNFDDMVVVGLELSKGKKILDVSKVFTDGDVLFDEYSNTSTEVKNGQIKINTEFDIVLLAKQ
jgi:alpha-amylase